VKVDPNALFTSISFDPRLQPFELNERIAEFREADYTGEILRDLNYQGAFPACHDAGLARSIVKVRPPLAQLATAPDMQPTQRGDSVPACSRISG